MKDKQVAVVYGDNGCELVAEIKMVTNQQLHTLENDFEKNKSKKAKKQKELLDTIDYHGKRVAHFEKNELLLAKSIYDNFVDRGLIDNDDQFQKDWYDYFLGDSKELNLSKAPNEYKKILEKVVNEK